MKTSIGKISVTKATRLEIAVELLKGHLVLDERDGYDPGGFRRNERYRTIRAALEMADALIRQDADFDKPEEDDEDESWKEEELKNVELD